MYKFQLKLHWSLFPRVQLTILQQRSDNSLASVRRQAIIWSNDGLVYWRIHKSLSLNELTLLAWIYKPLQWRHNDHDGVSNHQPHGCLLNRLFRRRSKKTSKLCVTGLCVGNSPGPVISPHKGPVTLKMFPFDDVIMQFCITGKTLRPMQNIFKYIILKGNVCILIRTTLKYIPKSSNLQ